MRNRKCQEQHNFGLIIFPFSASVYPSCPEGCCSIHSPHVIKQLCAQLWYVVVPGAHKSDAKENGST